MKILITPRGFANVGKTYIQKMKAAGFEVDYNQTGKSYTFEQFKRKAADADAIIVGVDQVNQELFASSPKLKAVCKFGVGIDNIDLTEATKRGIAVGRTVGSNSNSVAEHVLAFILADAKNLLGSVKEVKAGKWDKPTGSEIEGKILGIDGFGSIGKILAKKANNLGMKVLVNDIFNIDPKEQRAAGIKQVTFDELLERSDYLTLHLPLNEHTKDTINANELAKMKKNACLINAARGGIVNETALLLALRKKQIRSAYFDVFSEEPPKNGTELLALPNFYLTPHIAARTEEAELRTCAYSTRFILNALKED